MNDIKAYQRQLVKRSPNVSDRIRENVQARQQVQKDIEAEARRQAERAEDRLRQKDERAASDMRDLRDQFQKANDKIESLKDKVADKRASNNGLRGTSLAAIAGGTLAANIVFLQGETQGDAILKYCIALSSCFGAFMLNKYFHENDVKLNEVLRRTNEWQKGKFLPEEVQTFKELYDEVKTDYALDKTFNDQVSANKGYNLSQGVILALGIACLISASEKISIQMLNDVKSKQEEVEIPFEFNDPMIKTEQKLRFPDFDY